MKGPKNGVVCASLKSSTFNAETSEKKHCCLAISIGQPYHEELRLDTAISLIDSNFSKCTIALPPNRVPSAPSRAAEMASHPVKATRVIRVCTSRQ